MTISTATDLTLILPDRVGSLAHAMDVFGRAGVNIRGHGGFLAWAGEGVLHLVVDDTERGMAALREAGIEVREERIVITVGLPDRPGALAHVLQRVAAAGVNVDLTYALADGQVVLGVNDNRKAGRALGGTG
ncbi:MAG: ACT domain-containing protein [Chloroflexota bacterium]|nr:ACT domain-containing protein [Chloroflexota bacterium]